LTKELRKLHKRADFPVREARRILKRWRRRLDAAQLSPLLESLHSFETAFASGAVAEAQTALTDLERKLDGDFAYLRKSALRDWTESLLVALLIALFLRAFVVEAFKIPSGSMIPTLLVGDHIFVNKFSFGIRLPLIGKRIVDWGEPRRGDVIVFVAPHEPDKDYIKRVIGVPGDRIRVEGEHIFINGERILQGEPQPYAYFDETRQAEQKCLKYQAALGQAQFVILYNPSLWHETEEFTVGPGQYFVMGDNRDNSRDSREWGTVPIDNVKGKALAVWWSTGARDGFRFSRIGTFID